MWKCLASGVKIYTTEQLTGVGRQRIHASLQLLLGPGQLGRPCSWCKACVQPVRRKTFRHGEALKAGRHAFASACMAPIDGEQLAADLEQQLGTDLP